MGPLTSTGSGRRGTCPRLLPANDEGGGRHLPPLCSLSPPPTMGRATSVVGPATAEAAVPCQRYTDRASCTRGSALRAPPCNGSEASPRPQCSSRGEAFRSQRDAPSEQVLLVEALAGLRHERRRKARASRIELGELRRLVPRPPGLAPLGRSLGCRCRRLGRMSRRNDKEGDTDHERQPPGFPCLSCHRGVHHPDRCDRSPELANSHVKTL